MSDPQYDSLLKESLLKQILEKLEEIRCGLIDIETAIEKRNE